MLKKIIVSAILSLAFSSLSALAYTPYPPAYRSVASVAVTNNPNARIFPLYWPDTRVRDVKVVFTTEENQLILASWRPGQTLDNRSGVVLNNGRTGKDVPADTVHHVSAYYYNNVHFLLIGYKGGTVDSCLVRTPGGEVAGFYCGPALDSNGNLVQVSGNAAPSALKVIGWNYPILMVGATEGFFNQYWMNAQLQLTPQGYFHGYLDEDSYNASNQSPVGFGSSPSMSAWDLTLDGFPETVVGNGEGEVFMCNGSNHVCWPLVDNNGGSFGPVVLDHRVVPVFNDSDRSGKPNIYIGGDSNEITILRGY